MIENDIYEESNCFIVKKEIRGKWVTFGSFENLNDAIELRDELEDYGWPYRDETQFDEIEKYIYKEKNKFLVSKKFVGHDIVFGMFDSLNKAKSFKRRLVQNAWNLNFYTRPSKYGKYIKRLSAKRYGIFKEIDGEEIDFGHFKTVDEAIIVRDELIDNNWNMGEDKILSNLGVLEFDLGIGLVGRKFIVFEWNDSKCIIYGFYTSRRLAREAKEKLFNKNNGFGEDIDYNYEDTRYIHRVNDYYRITKVFGGKPKNFGHYRSLEEAISIRDKLIQNNWDDSFLGLTRITRGKDSYNRHINKSPRGYEVVNRIDGYLYNFGSFESLEEAISFRDYLEENNWEIGFEEENLEEEKFDEYVFLKEDGKYYLKNDIDGVTRIFGIFDNPLDAIAARLDCIKNNWDSTSIIEEEYLKNPNIDFNFGHLNDEIEEITDDMVGSSLLNESIDFPVTVGKSYKNGGWAVKRSYLNEFIPLIPFEKECSILVDGIKVVGKMNIHTRLFYFKDDILSKYLKNLHDIDPKAQTRITFELNNGIYKYSGENIGDLEFITKFSKSFKKGLFAVPRSISKNIIPILPYELECNFLINGIKCIGKFNLEFRFRFSDDSFISKLESKFDENEELKVKLLL